MTNCSRHCFEGNMATKQLRYTPSAYYVQDCTYHTRFELSGEDFLNIHNETSTL
jgi:hypothetical protein